MTYLPTIFVPDSTHSALPLFQIFRRDHTVLVSVRGETFSFLNVNSRYSPQNVVGTLRL